MTTTTKGTAVYWMVVLLAALSNSQPHLLKQQIHTWKEPWFSFRKKSVVSR